ncbi:hypothetical protein FQN53_006948 [Emmonsiellopsis sp. PD_33]|nr:hypothetical protein FQN53_006948 [Emmonsiellopsis sp. PD_33]
MHLNFVTVFSLLAAAGQGYILDDSCTKDANALNFMTVNLGWTFESARIARDALARRPWNKEEDGPLMDLATWIFKEDGSEPQVPRPLYETKEVLLNNAHDPRRNLDKLRDVLTNVLDLDGKTIRRKQPQVRIARLRRDVPSRNRDKAILKIDARTISGDFSSDGSE